MSSPSEPWGSASECCNLNDGTELGAVERGPVSKEVLNGKLKYDGSRTLQRDPAAKATWPGRLRKCCCHMEADGKKKLPGKIF